MLPGWGFAPLPEPPTAAAATHPPLLNPPHGQRQAPCTTAQPSAPLGPSAHTTHDHWQEVAPPLPATPTTPPLVPPQPPRPSLAIRPPPPATPPAMVTDAPQPTPAPPWPRTAHLPVTTSRPTSPRTAARQLRSAHRLHKLLEHKANQHPKRQQLAPRVQWDLPPTQPPQGPVRRDLHAVPSPQHPARLGPSPHRRHTVANTVSPLTQAELFEVLSETQRKSNPHVPARGLMFPGPLAQNHPAGEMLIQFGTKGCPVEIADEWTLEQLDAAVAYGAHPSATTPEAAAALHAEAMEKVNAGLAQLRPWKEIRALLRKGLLKKVKVSPIAAIPHKSRLFRMILDLSDKGQRRTDTKSVNELTNEDTAPRLAMDNLGKVLHRFIYTVGTADPDKGPLLFCKLDIKDGFWRMCVPEDDQMQFCYVLPPLPTSDSTNPTASLDDVMLVVPAALQMGWTSSPAFFCAATETGRDVAEDLRLCPELPPHPLEHHMTDPIPPHLLQLPAHTPDVESLLHLFEVYIDDFCALLQSTDPTVLLHHSRALLHAIHQIFPPPTATGDPGEDPVSHKKLVLDQEGVWDTRKEILGWIFDGLHRTIELPPKKLETLRELTQQLLRERAMPLTDFRSFMGKCQHAALGVPGGTALLAPLYRVIKTADRCQQPVIRIHARSPQAQALRDLRTIFAEIGKRPTSCAQLIPSFPHFVGFCDACKHGAGGIWLSGSNTLRPVVWRFAWPPEVVQAMDSGLITINDLEMAGILLQFLVLEGLVPVHHIQSAVWCDNTSAVAWVTKMSSKRSAVGQQLARALALRLVVTQSSHLAPLSIAGKDNHAADLASRSFKATGTAGNYELTHSQFFARFSRDFPLTQDGSWLMLRLNTKLTSLVSTVLLGTTPPTGSWLRLPTHIVDIGVTGPAFAGRTTWIPFSEELKDKLKLTSCPLSLATSARGVQAGDLRSALHQFRTRWAPSPRPFRWLDSPAQSGTSTAATANSGHDSTIRSRAMPATTPPKNPSSPSP